MAMDTEDNSKGKVFLINFFDGTNHYTFKKPKKAIEFLLTHQFNADIWATNAAYDVNNIFKDHLHLIEMTQIGSRMIKAKIKNSSIYIYDTLNPEKAGRAKER